MLVRAPQETVTTSLNISDQLANLSAAERSALVFNLLKERTSAAPRKQTITRGPECDTAPLSHNQQGLFVLSQMMAGASIYHTPTAARLRGPLDRDLLQQAINAVVERHQTLRTTFISIDGTPQQMIARNAALELPLLDLNQVPTTDREVEAERTLKEEVHRPFDLSQGPLIRALLVRIADDDHILLLTMHHVITDGWSLGILHREISQLYKAFSVGRPSPLAPLPIQYSDFAKWQRKEFQSGAYEAQLSYWKTQFATLPPALELPRDCATSTADGRTFRGAQQTLVLPTEVGRAVATFSQQEGVTLFMTLLAGFQTLLHRYTNEEDIVIGSPIAGRQLPETEDLIGLFINTLPLRTDLSGNPTFRELLARVKEVALGAYANQDLSFERLVKELQPERAAATNPLFQVMFVLQNEQMLPLQLPGVEVEQLKVDHAVANFDLTLEIAERDDELVCSLEYNADRFGVERIVRMLGHFRVLLEGIVANSDRPLSELPLLTDTERHQLLTEWTNTSSDYPAQESIQQLFEEQAGLSPESIALVSDDESVTYRELNKRANQFAHFLKRRGVGPETRVGVCLERSPELIVALLGILKAGGAYVPLDASYPQTRLEFMIADSGMTLLLTDQARSAQFPDGGVDIVCVDELRAEIAAEGAENLKATTTADNLAYVMYTSGSTGMPKGVAIIHRNVVRLVKGANYATLSPSEVLLQFAPISFDASTFEIWGSLLNGAQLALMPPGAASLEELGRALKRYKVTTLWLTAGLFHLMVDERLDDLRGLRQLLAGGDVLSAPHARKVLRELKGVRLINGYGPTENTTFSCCFATTDPQSINGSVPIGRPISNTYAYVLDRHRNPVPVGVPGELYVGGAGVARGYLNRPDLTAATFINDPFKTNADARLYRTGDLVRYRANGEIDFLGRLDSQVKVSGHRIELGEIETVLCEHKGVREAIVLAQTDNSDKRLSAYIVPSPGEPLSAETLRHFVKRKLPDHMVPSNFFMLEALPLSPNGKVDRKALSALSAPRSETPKEFLAPSNELEVKLARIWERVLDVDSISVHDNFFELGGHSLMAVRLFAQIEKSFGRNLPLATLFQAPTVAQLARVLREQGWSAPWSSLVLIQSGGARTPFFAVHAAGGNVIEYRDLARALGPDQPFYGLQARGLDGRDAPHTSIAEMAAHYITELREVQPHGPYLIGGHSSGGLIAFEMARQLEVDGERVALLALFDAYPAGYFKLSPASGSLRLRLSRSAKRFAAHLGNLGQLDHGRKTKYLRTKLSYTPEKIKHRVFRGAYKLYERIGRPLPAALKNIEELNFMAVDSYVPQFYSGSATLFLATDLTASYDLREGWRELIKGGIDVHEISGDHINVIQEPHVRVLAEKLRACLDDAQLQNQER